MKYFASALVIVALFNSQVVNAILLKAESSGDFDLIKDLTESMNADAESGENLAQADESTATADESKKEVKQETEKKAEVKTEVKKTETKKEVKKVEVKKVAEVKVDEKKEEEDIPMDSAAIKAYSSVIADAAEDSEPQQAVIYTETMQEEPAQRSNFATGVDPMGSMIQNEIEGIKEASIKAA